jgi:hypothetical protein
MWTRDHYKYKCSDGYHNSFWATVIESHQWKEWEKEVSRRMHTKTLKGCWDVDECRECGCLSPRCQNLFGGHR